MKYNLGDNLTATVKRKKLKAPGWGAWEWSVWEGDELIEHGSFLQGERFETADDVVDQLAWKYIEEPGMVCYSEEGPSDADPGL